MVSKQTKPVPNGEKRQLDSFGFYPKGPILRNVFGLVIWSLLIFPIAEELSPKDCLDGRSFSATFIDLCQILKVLLVLF